MRAISLTTLKGDLSADGASNKVTTGYLQVAGEVELTSSLSVLSSTSLFGRLIAFKEDSFESSLSLIGSTDSATFKRSLSVMSFVSFTDAMTVAGASRRGSDLSVFDSVRLGSKLPQYRGSYVAWQLTLCFWRC